MKILVADDDKYIQAGIRVNLEKSGYKVIYADNGEDCLRLTISEKPDLLVLDLLMPGIDGSSAFDYIRQNAVLQENSEIAEYLRDVPIIILSGFDDEKTKEWFAGRNVAAYFTKPADINALIAKIGELTQGKNKEA